jgi:UDP-2,3-diacylglucosamine hydrolase
MGNHDFGHYRYFREELEIEVERGDLDVRIGTRRLYVCHGDGKAHNDLGYLVLRSVLRSPLANRLYRMIHPDWGIGLASATSKGSRDHTSHKDYGPHDGLRDFAKARIDEGYDLVVMGHRHRAAVEPYGSGTYVNLGHWLDEGATYGVFLPDDGLRLVEVE